MEQAGPAEQQCRRNCPEGESATRQARQRSNQGDEGVWMAAARFRSYRNLRGTGNPTRRYGLRQNPTWVTIPLYPCILTRRTPSVIT